MKIKAVSGITCYTKNIKRTIGFYDVLGFESRK